MTANTLDKCRIHKKNYFVQIIQIETERNTEIYSYLIILYFYNN